MLRRLATANFNPAALLAQGVPIDDLVGLARSPEFRAKFETLMKFWAECLTLRATQSRILALDKLSEAAQEADSPVEKRRAATALARATAAPLNPSPRSEPRARPAANDTASSPAPAPSASPRPACSPAPSPPASRPPAPLAVPDPALAPAAVADLLAAAAMNPDQPSPDAGFATLSAFLADAFRLDDARPDRSTPDTLFNALANSSLEHVDDGVSRTPESEELTDTRATYRFLITTLHDARTARLTVGLSRSPPNAWLLSSLAAERLDAPP